jgi:hypothetical protein
VLSFEERCSNKEREQKMDEDKGCQLHYINCGKLKELLVRKTGSPGFTELHPGIVQLSPRTCCFEREGTQEFQVKDTLEFLFDLEDCFCTAQATVVSVDGWSCLDEGYHHKRWYNYRVEFHCELDESVCERLFAGPKRSVTVRQASEGKLPQAV